MPLPGALAGRFWAMLEKFRIAKLREIAGLREKAEKGALPPPFAGKRMDFALALKNPKDGDIAIIAEYKRASPSKGLICDRLTPEECAMRYEEAGASAISILTEEDWFAGRFDFLDQAALACGGRMPILRKDFIFDPLQVRATASSRASALLLVVRQTPDIARLKMLRELAESFGIQCVVEAFNEEEIKIARESGAGIIQVNARDLSTLRVDREECLNLIRKSRPEASEIWIQASGVENREQIEAAREAGFHAVLVGTSLMRDGEPGKALQRLKGKC